MVKKTSKSWISSLVLMRQVEVLFSEQWFIQHYGGQLS